MITKSTKLQAVKFLPALLTLFIFSLNAHASANRFFNKPASLNTDSALNKLAPDFTLKDIDGKTVSLADYKGKTLIIDFWATWCVPCRNSFPAVKIAVEKYKDDPNVKFLFIDTRETEANYPQLAEKFLKDNQYPFYVAFDEKSDDGKMDLTYKKYVMPGIPTKYFIDGKGIIRFKLIGYNPNLTVDQTAAEIEETIEKVKAAN